MARRRFDCWRRRNCVKGRRSGAAQMPRAVCARARASAIARCRHRIADAAGLRSRRPSSPSSRAVPSQHQSLTTWTSTRSPKRLGSRIAATPAKGHGGIACGARAARNRAWCSAADSAPTHAPAQRATCRAKHGPTRRSRPSAFQHNRCSPARLRSVSRAARRDENGPNRPASSRRFDAGRGHEARRPRLVRQFENPRFGLAPQRVVVGGQHRLHQRRLAQQRADLAGRFLEFDPPDFGRQPQIGRRTVIGRKMRADALAQILALADVERQRIEPVEQVDARRFRHRVQRVGRQLRRQAGRSQHAPGGGLDRLRRQIAIERLHERPQHARVAQRAVASVDGRARGARSRCRDCGGRPPGRAAATGAPCTAPGR